MKVSSLHMNVIDTYNNIQTMFLNYQFNLQQWREYANQISTHLAHKLEEDAKDYNLPTDVYPVIRNMFLQKEKIEKAHNSFRNTTHNLSNQLLKVFGIDLDVDLIFYLGLCNGAGWATDLNGKPVILLGLEKIVELNWCDETNMIALIYHELGHIWHNQTRTRKTIVESPKEKALWQLYREGIAMYCEQLLYGDINFYHQNTNGWLTFCQRNQSRLYQEYKRRMDHQESVQDFYGDWCQFEEHSDLGYYLGAELIKELAKEYNLYELANLELHTMEAKLIQCLK